MRLDHVGRRRDVGFRRVGVGVIAAEKERHRRGQIPPLLALVDRHRVDDLASLHSEFQPAAPKFPFEQRNVETRDVESGEIRILEVFEQPRARSS